LFEAFALPETNSSPLKINGWKMYFLFAGTKFGYSFRKGKATWKTKISHQLGVSSVSPTARLSFSTEATTCSFGVVWGDRELKPGPNLRGSW